MRFAPRKLGWIGVDIGTATVKIAQVARSKQGWRVAASVVIPRQQIWQSDQVAGKDAISTLGRVASGSIAPAGGTVVEQSLRRCRCRCAMCNGLDRDLNSESNAPQILRQAIETATQQSIEHVQCDYWSGPKTESQPGWTQAITVSRDWTEQLCEDIAQAGWSCEAIDGFTPGHDTRRGHGPHCRVAGSTACSARLGQWPARRFALLKTVSLPMFAV